MFACLHGTGNLAAVAFDFSPLVERTAPDTVTCDVAGLDRLFGAAQELAAALARRAAETGARASIALAANPDAAISAARGFSGVSIVPQGDEAKFLGRLPVALLEPSDELRETLDRWGIRRFQDLAALPPLGIAERLGAEGLHLRELARGEAGRKLTPIEEPEQFEDELELEYPVELLEPLEFLLARLLNGLTTRLATRGLATDELRLRLHLETRAIHERTLRLPAPSLDGKSFLKLLRLDLAGHPPAAPIERIQLGVNPVKPQAAQGGLFVLAAPEPVKLELTLARIQAIVGEGRAGCPELLDTHRPDAFRIQKPVTGYAVPASSMHSKLAETGGQTPLSTRRKSGALGQWCLSPAPCGVSPKLIFRMYRPPRIARVTLASGQPSFLSAEGIRGRILERAGPWRTSGDWWTIDPWSRDEWDIALSDGALYRIYCEIRGWFVEGSYD
jgi:protein ImuB